MRILLLQSTAINDEVKHYKEMCANYEQQLQRTQRQMTQEMGEKEEAMESIMDTLEKHKVRESKQEFSSEIRVGMKFEN